MAVALARSTSARCPKMVIRDALSVSSTSQDCSDERNVCRGHRVSRSDVPTTSRHSSGSVTGHAALLAPLNWQMTFSHHEQWKHHLRLILISYIDIGSVRNMGRVPMFNGSNFGSLTSHLTIVINFKILALQNVHS